MPESTQIIDLSALPEPTVGGEDHARWEESALRERMMRGEWMPDLVARMPLKIDMARLNAQGRPTISLNAERAFVGQISIQADQEPVVTCEDASEEQLAEMEAWRPLRLHQQLARMVVAVREYVVALDWDETADEPSIRLVAPKVLVRGTTKAPHIPVHWEEPVARKRAGYSAEWLWFVWDISDPAAPYWRIEKLDGSTSGRKDVTLEYATDEELTWYAAYPWVDADLGPYLPWVLFHAREPDRIWDWREGQEGVEATFDIAAGWSMWNHLLFNASWAQKFSINLRLAGKVPKPDGEVATVPIDPVSLLMFKAEDASGSIGTLGVAVDPESFARSIRLYMGTVAESFGLAASDLELSSDASSGVAISLRRDAVRRLQRPIAATLARASEEMLGKLAAIATMHGHPMPTTGWHVEFPALEPTREEMEQAREDVGQDLEAGLTSRVEILMQRDGLTRPEAIARLLQYAADEAQIARARAELLTPPALRGAPPPPPGAPEEEPAEDDDEDPTPDPVE